MHDNEPAASASSSAGPSSSQPPPDQLKLAVEAIFRQTPADQRKKKARKLLEVFHPDRQDQQGNPELKEVFAGAVRVLTAHL